MARIIGRNTSIGLVKAATRGTLDATAAFWIPVLDLDFDDAFDLADNESGFANNAAISDSQIVKQWAEGGYTGKIFEKSVGLEFTLLFGQSPTSVQRSTTGVYDHSFTKLSSNQHKTGSLYVNESNFAGGYANAGINSWSLNAELGDYLRRSVSYIAKKGVTSAQTVSYTDENEFLPDHMTVKLAAQGSVDTVLDSATAVKVRAVSMEWNKNAEGTQVMGSKDIDDVINKQDEITGTIEVYYDDRTWHTLAQGNTHRAMRLDMINTAVIIGTSGSNNPAVRLQHANIIFGQPQRSFDNNGIMTLSIPYRSALDIATGTQITGRVTNAYAGTLY